MEKIKKYFISGSRNVCYGSNSGQALVEFIFLVPIFFIVFFVLVQFANNLDSCQKSKMALWCGMRAPSIPDQSYYGVSVLTPLYNVSDVSNWIHTDVFSKNDIVDINIKKGYGPIPEITPGTVSVQINGYVPYLFQNSLWTNLTNIFKGQTVTRQGKQYFVTSSTGTTDYFATALPPV
jgi:hypothetical protein